MIHTQPASPSIILQPNKWQQFPPESPLEAVLLIICTLREWSSSAVPLKIIIQLCAPRVSSLSESGEAESMGGQWETQWSGPERMRSDQGRLWTCWLRCQRSAAPREIRGYLCDNWVEKTQGAAKSSEAVFSTESCGLLHVKKKKEKARKYLFLKIGILWPRSHVHRVDIGFGWSDNKW